MIEPHQEVAISLTKAEWLQIVLPSIGKQPYELVAGVMQKMGGQMQMQEMQNGLSLGDVPTPITRVADGSG